MAKRETKEKKGRTEKDLIAEPVVTNCCGDCVQAYDFCRWTADRKPILCRCRNRKEVFFRLCSTAACNEYESRELPVSGEVPYGLVGKDVFDTSGKVVPLFRKGDEKPFKVIPINEIPNGGIRKEMYSD